MAEYTDETGENTKDEIRLEALEKFESASEAFHDNMERYESDVKFARKGEQWEQSDIERRRQDGRPALTVNRLPSFIRQVVNDARQNKPQIKVHPVDSDSDVETAEVINGLIRNIEAVSKADLAYDTAIDCTATGGIGYFRVDVDYADRDTFDMDIRINRILNPMTVYPDPTSTAADSSDWNCCFVTEMQTEDEFKQNYPDADPISWEGDKSNTEKLWYDTTEKQVRIAEYWKRTDEDYEIVLLNNGAVIQDDVYEDNKEAFFASGILEADRRPSTKKKVTQYIMNGAEILETNEWLGSYIPIIPVYGEEVYIDGERHFYGLVHFAKDAQTMYNYWRTTTTELVAMAPKAPWIGKAGSFDTDMENWQNAHTDTIPFLEYDGDIPPQRQPFAGPPAGALQEALNATDDMKAVMGLHDASMGAQSNEIAGVAIAKRIREGDTSTFHFVDNMSRAIRHAGVVIIDLIPHVYSEARMIRVLGEDGMPQTVAINQPLTKEEEMLQGEAVERREAMQNTYNLTVGKYDVTVKAGPSYTTQREEARESMIALLQAFPSAAQVTGDLVVESMDWPNADVFAKRLKSLLPPGVIDEGQDPQAAALAQQVEQMDAVIQQLMAGKEEAMAKVAVDNRKVDIDAMRAATDRMNAETNLLKAQADAAAKSQDNELKAAEMMKDEPIDETPVTLKAMELNHDQAKTEIDTAFKERELDLKEREIALDEARLAADVRQSEIDACLKAEEAASPQVGVDLMNQPQEQPVQVFNVQSGSKNIDIKRGTNGEIIGAEVHEE